MLAAILALSMGASQEFLPNGIWSSPHYGFVLQIDDKRVARYDLADKMCVHSGQMPISAAVGLWGVAKTSVDGRSARLLSSPSQYHFDRLDALPAPCAAPLKTEDPKTNLEVFLATFDAHYPFFAERGIDWAAMKSAARDQLAAGADLFDVLSRIVNALGDGHVALAAGERIAKPDPVYAPGRAPDGKEWTWRSLRNAFKAHFEGPNSPLAGPPKLTANQRVFYGKTKSGAGYVAIMAQGAWRQGQDEETPASEHAAAAGQVLDEIMKELAGVNGMIVDIRVNSGGFDSVSLEIASRFAASQSLAYWKSAKGPDGESPAYAVHVTPSSGARRPGPVALLIGRNTVSAGETLAIAFRALPHARLFGHPTRGILSDAIPKSLPNGWEYTMSVEIARAPDGALLEVAGVQPHSSIPDPKSADANYWNEPVAQAEKWLGQNSTGR